MTPGSRLGCDHKTFIQVWSISRTSLIIIILISDNNNISCFKILIIRFKMTVRWYLLGKWCVWMWMWCYLFVCIPNIGPLPTLHSWTPAPSLVTSGPGPAMRPDNIIILGLHLQLFVTPSRSGLKIMTRDEATLVGFIGVIFITGNKVIITFWIIIVIKT